MTTRLPCCVPFCRRSTARTEFSEWLGSRAILPETPANSTACKAPVAKVDSPAGVCGGSVVSCGAPGLYVHIPEHDVSAWHALDLRASARALAAVDAALRAGTTKTVAWRGLWSSPRLMDRLITVLGANFV